MSRSPCLDVRSLTRVFGGFALREITFDVDAGEYVAIVGPCGAGKTLLMETIAGFHDHPAATIFLQGQDAESLPPERRHLGYLCQGNTLFEHLSVRENIRFGLRYLRGAVRGHAEGRIERLLPLLGIKRLFDRPDTGNLSGGEARLVALARALAPGPRLLLMDEPIHSLDVAVAKRVLRVLARIPAETGVPVLHITHDIAEVERCADRLVVLDRGVVVQAGRLRELRRRPATRFAAELAASENLFEIPAGLRVLELNGCRIAVDRLPAGTGGLLGVLDPERLELVPSPSPGASGRVVGIRETAGGAEVRIAIDGRRLTVHLPPDRMLGELMYLGAPVKLRVPERALHLLREEKR